MCANQSLEERTRIMSEYHRDSISFYLCCRINWLRMMVLLLMMIIEKIIVGRDKGRKELKYEWTMLHMAIEREKMITDCWDQLKTPEHIKLSPGIETYFRGIFSDGWMNFSVELRMRGQRRGNGLILQRREETSLVIHLGCLFFSLLFSLWLPMHSHLFKYRHTHTSSTKRRKDERMKKKKKNRRWKLVVRTDFFLLFIAMLERHLSETVCAHEDNLLSPCLAPLFSFDWRARSLLLPVLHRQRDSTTLDLNELINASTYEWMNESKRKDDECEQFFHN